MLYVVVPSYDVPVSSMGLAIAKGMFGAKIVASVEGTTVETTSTAV